MKPVIPSILNSGIPVEFACDWGKIARLIVHDSLKTHPGEKAIIHAAPTYFSAPPSKSESSWSAPVRLS